MLFFFLLTPYLVVAVQPCMEWILILKKFSRSRYVIDLQFWPVLDINKVRWLSKFLISHLFDWYFTDWSVNYLYCWIFNELVGEILWNFPFTQPLLIKIHRYISKIQMIACKIERSVSQFNNSSVSVALVERKKGLHEQKMIKMSQITQSF